MRECPFWYRMFNHNCFWLVLKFHSLLILFTISSYGFIVLPPFYELRSSRMGDRPRYSYVRVSFSLVTKEEVIQRLREVIQRCETGLVDFHSLCTNT